MLHGQVDQVKLLAIKSMLTENNQHYTSREMADILKNIQMKKVTEISKEIEKCVFYVTEKTYGLFANPMFTCQP